MAASMSTPIDEQEMRKMLLDTGTLDPKEVKKASRGTLIAMLFEEFAEKHLIQPHHIIDHPIETTPLCKLHRDPKLCAKRICRAIRDLYPRQRILQLLY